MKDLEFKGTKGKWRVFISGFLIEDKNGKTIAAAVSSLSKIPVKEANANAKLIAAAPDLLEALQKIASNSNDHAMIRIAIKAINKALKQ